ncbi:MAG: NUDIX hydrolase [Arachnia sp.]
MAEFRVRVDVSAGIGTLRWDEQRVDADTLHRAVSLAADDALIAHNLRRVQVQVPATDRPARSALHRAGFRLEGLLRSAHHADDGTMLDVAAYARLAADPVYGQEGFSGVMNSVLPTKRVISHAVFRDDLDRVLLTQTRYKPDWELPGGVVEPGETPRDGARREVLEEIGLGVEFGQPAIIDWMPPYLGWSDAIEFIFDGGSIDAETAAALGPCDHEIAELHWVPLAEVDSRVTELSARRIRLLCEGYTGITEGGHPVA